jgi:hypothetical protein
MGNHVHFVLEPRRRWSISFLMRDLQSYHSRCIHASRGIDGHSWKHHFGAKLIDSGEYYRAVIRYIELNPIGSGRFNKPDQYFYSSAKAHIQGNDIVLEHLGFKVGIQLYWKRWQQEIGELNWASYLSSPDQASLDTRIAEVQKIPSIRKKPTSENLPDVWTRIKHSLLARLHSTSEENPNTRVPTMKACKYSTQRR